MKAVILAAGDGTRLDPLTRDIPKPLVPVAGQPMVTYALQALIEAGVTELIIVVGYLGGQIRHELGETHYRGMRLTYVESPDHRDGNGLSLFAARGAIGEEPFILTMADHLVSTPLIRWLLETRLSHDVLCVDRQPPSTVELDEATRVWVDGAGRIGRIGKNLQRWNGLDTGVFWLTSAIFHGMEALVAIGARAPTLTQACCWLIECGSGLGACDVSGAFWMDVDTPADLRRAERALRARGKSLLH